MAVSRHGGFKKVSCGVSMSRRREERRCSRCSDPAMPAPCGPRTRLPAGNMAHIHECGRPRYTSTSCTTPPGTVTLAPDITFAWLLGTSHGHTPSTIHIRRQAWQGHARVRHALLLRSRLLQTVAPKHRSKLKLCQQAGINSSSSDSSCSTGAATAPAPARRRRHQRRCRARRRRRQRRRLNSAARTAMKTASIVAAHATQHQRRPQPRAGPRAPDASPPPLTTYGLHASIRGP